MQGTLNLVTMRLLMVFSGVFYSKCSIIKYILIINYRTYKIFCLSFAINVLVSIVTQNIEITNKVKKDNCIVLSY